MSPPGGLPALLLGAMASRPGAVARREAAAGGAWMESTHGALRDQALRVAAGLRSLGVVAEMALGEDGIFRAADLGENMGERRGVRREGNRIQMGLTNLEIDRVRRRIEKLLDEVDEGRLPVR